ncbi:cytochrome P450 [Apiospora aurea]|uniref:Cytochrome P450 n=1 Tax=Apiospora aurea TaxID=335848 RepID=A0ABR1PUR2_9PEZI
MEVTFEYLSWACLSILVALLVTLVRFSLKSLRPRNYPPGPPALPFIGNVHHFAAPKPFLKFAEWRAKYGDIIGLKIGPGNLVVLNSARLVRDLLDKRGSIYSGRPSDYVVRNHIVFGAQHILFLPYDGYLKQWRTAVVRHLLGPTGVEQVLPVLEAMAAHLAYRLAADPARFADHFRNWALATPLLAICGHRGEQKEAALVDLFYGNQDNWLTLLTPGVAPPVEMFPVLKWVPTFLAKWKRTARDLRRNQQGFYGMMLESAKEERRLRRAASLSSEEAPLRRKAARPSSTITNWRISGGGLLDAAVDTTYSTALTFVKILAARPEIMKKAQAEIESVCGSDDGPPQPKDVNKLPYLRACYSEILRWRPPAPNNLPHVLDADDTVGGYHLPKGTVVLQNTWAIERDPELYSDPDEFNPERYIGNVYGVKPSAKARCRAEGRKPNYAFGSGRRQCPGDLFAVSSVMMVAAKLVWGFEFKPIREHPLDLSVESGFHGGLVLGSEEFEVGFVPRSEERRRAMVEDYERTRGRLQ